ncbi:uncharacterized protein LOC110662881 [Hevea brasiliensis]|uniref:uncharacterized protein LOC110662881 n=1 Tax=Hevea brasiliensis TaxID=3981 RepID=UPI0025DB81E9|nr:uncharacterized protein LOC110662881 [Hevea brasiliensis]
MMGYTPANGSRPQTCDLSTFDFNSEQSFFLFGFWCFRNPNPRREISASRIHPFVIVRANVAGALTMNHIRSLRGIMSIKRRLGHWTDEHLLLRLAAKQKKCQRGSRS